MKILFFLIRINRKTALKKKTTKGKVHKNIFFLSNLGSKRIYSLYLSTRKLLGNNFSLIYVKAKISTLEKRDTNGLYLKQRKGEIKNLIGLSKSNIYEVAKDYDLLLNTESDTSQVSSKKLYKFILTKFN